MKKKIWKKISNFEFDNCKDLLQYMEKRNIQYSPWIKNIVEKYNYSFKDYKLPVDLYRVSLSELSFSEPTKLKDVYKKSRELGYFLVNPELAFLTRLFYDEQSTGEWLRFATPLNSMIDDDGVPHLPKLGKALNQFFIETYWSYPDAVFHPHNEFVFTSLSE